MQRCQHHRKSWRTNHLQGSANPVINVNLHATGCQAGRCSQQFDNQALCCTALKSQTAKGVMIGHINFVGHDMHDIGVIPHHLRRQCTAPNLHPVDAIVSHQVVANQCTAVTFKLLKLFDHASAATAIGKLKGVQRIHVNADDRASGGTVIPELIVHDDWLSPAHKDRRRIVGSTPVSIWV